MRVRVVLVVGVVFPSLLLRLGLRGKVTTTPRRKEGTFPLSVEEEPK